MSANPRYRPEHQTPEGCGLAPDIDLLLQMMAEDRLDCAKCKAARAEVERAS